MVTVFAAHMGEARGVLHSDGTDGKTPLRSTSILCSVSAGDVVAMTLLPKSSVSLDRSMRLMLSPLSALPCCGGKRL